MNLIKKGAYAECSKNAILFIAVVFNWLEIKQKQASCTNLHGEKRNQLQMIVTLHFQLKAPVP